MKRFLSVLLALFLASSAVAFSSTSFVGTRLAAPRSSSKLHMFFGPKDDGSPGDYVCQDCGYVFTQGPAAWQKLPDSWSCPPCGSVKRRFKKVPKGSASGKVTTKKKGGFFG